MPDHNDDVQIVPPWAVELSKDIRAIRADIAIVSNDLGVVKDRVSILETWRLTQDARADECAERAKAAALVVDEEKVAREGLALKVAGLERDQKLQLDILSRLDTLTSNPRIKAIVGLLVTALITWLSTHGIKLP